MSINYCGALILHFLIHSALPMAPLFLTGGTSCAVPFTSILPIFPNAASTKSSGSWKSPFKRFEVPLSSSLRAETNCAGVQAEWTEREGVSEGDQKVEMLGRWGNGVRGIGRNLGR